MGSRVRTSAFTLLEMLLALGVLVAIAAIAAPALYEQIAPRTFAYTANQVAAELRLAREDARRTNEILLIYASRDPESGRTRLESRGFAFDETDPDADLGSPNGPFDMPVSGGDWFSPGGSASGSASGAAGPAGSRVSNRFGAGSAFGLPGEGRSSEDSFDSQDEPARLRLLLPEGHRLTSERPALLDPDADFGDMFSDQARAEIGGLEPQESGIPSMEFDEGPGSGGPAGEDFSDDSARWVAICVPDGTVLPAGPLWLVAEGNRIARLVIEPASGVIRCEVQDVARPGFDELGLDAEDNDRLDANGGSGRAQSDRATRPGLRTQPADSGGRP